MAWGGAIHPYIIVSKNVIIRDLKGSVVIKNPSIGCIKLGFSNVAIKESKDISFVWENSGQITFNRDAIIGIGSKISNRGILIFGRNFVATSEINIIVRKKIEFGENCLISWDTLFMDSDLHSIYNCSDLNNEINKNKEIYIGNHVWIGCECLILKGSIISDNAVIAARSTITNKTNFKESSIITTSKIIKDDIYWDYKTPR